MNDYKIKELYEEMEMELISSMKRNLKRHLKEEDKTGFKYPQWQAEKLKELQRYRRQNQDIIGEYTNELDEEVAKHIQDEVKQGSINAIKQYNKILKQNLKPSKVMNNSFFKTNDRKVNALIKIVNDDLKTVNTSALRMINDQYRQVIHKSAFFVGNGVFTEQQATKMSTKELTDLKLTELAIDEANKSFLAGGLNCIEYKNGRRVNIASYSQMAVRTANLRAQLMGEGDFRKSIGRTLVQATSHGGACPICQKWEKHIFIDDVYSGGTKEDGNYMLLSEAMAQGFLHPSCRHGLTTYYPELEGIENETEEEYQADWDYINEKLNERMNYIDRNIKKYDRLENGSISSLNIQMFAQKKKDWEKEKELLSYDDITKKWLSETGNNIGTVTNQTFFIDKNNVKYKVDNIHVILDHTKNEEDIAQWYAITKKRDVKMLPRVLKPQNIKTGDFIEKETQIIWEIKEPEGNTPETTMLNQFKGQKNKAHKFIIDIHRSKMEVSHVIAEIEKILSNKRYIWIEEVILLKNKKLIKVFRK